MNLAPATPRRAAAALAAAAVLVPFSAPAPALPQLPFTAPSTESTVYWPNLPSFGGGGPFRDVLVADLTGDLAPDAVVLDGGVAVLVYGVHVYSACSELTPPNESVVAMAALPGPDRDTLYTTSSLGLSRHDFDPAQATFTHVVEEGVAGSARSTCASSTSMASTGRTSSASPRRVPAS